MQSVLNESAAIALYVAEKYPDRGLVPSDLRQRAEVYRWSFFAVTELEQPVWRIARHTHLYPEHERLPADIALARRDFMAMAAVLENHMKGRLFVASDRATVADFIVAYSLDMGDVVGLLDGFPNLQGYLERMYARPRAPRRIDEIFRNMKSVAKA